MKALELIGLFFNFAGSLLLGLGMIRSKDRIEKESKTYWGSNPYAKKFFSTDRVIGFFGVGLLAIGFLLQFVSFYL